MKTAKKGSSVGPSATRSNKKKEASVSTSKLNDGFMNPAKAKAKAIMIKDKGLVIKEAVQQSKDLLLKHLLRITRLCADARTPAKLSAALLDLNRDYDCSIREPTSNERSLTAGFAVFISLALKAKTSRTTAATDAARIL